MNLDVGGLISIFHILVVVPFLGYIFIQKAATPDWGYLILLLIGSIMLIYQIYRFFIKFIFINPFFKN